MPNLKELEDSADKARKSGHEIKSLGMYRELLRAYEQHRRTDRIRDIKVKMGDAYYGMYLSFKPIAREGLTDEEKKTMDAYKTHAERLWTETGEEKRLEELRRTAGSISTMVSAGRGDVAGVKGFVAEVKLALRKIYTRPT